MVIRDLVTNCLPRGKQRYTSLMNKWVHACLSFDLFCLLSTTNYTLSINTRNHTSIKTLHEYVNLARVARLSNRCLLLLSVESLSLRSICTFFRRKFIKTIILLVCPLPRLYSRSFGSIWITCRFSWYYVLVGGGNTFMYMYTLHSARLASWLNCS